MDNRNSKLLKFSWILKKCYEKNLEKVLTKYELSQNEGSVLLFLHNNNLNTAKEISEYRSISKSLVSKSVDSLCKKGYIDIREDEEDKRINRLYITENAKEAVEKLSLAQDEFYILLEKGIKKEDLRVMDRVLKKLYNNVYKEINNNY